MLLRRCCFILLVFAAHLSCAKPPAVAARLAAGPPPRPYHLHLPGIGGKLRMDRYMIEGLRHGYPDAEIEVYDWTRNDPGLDALLNYGRNREEAEHVARIVLDRAREPRRKITITAHSGGAGLAVWALEKLPADVQIDTLIFLAPALSPQYDLTSALRHVRHAYAFTSPLDVAVLGIGTKIFGTIDGVKTEAAGKIGFIRPPAGDEREYSKLVQLPYRPQWMRYNNIGDHIGCMSPLFANEFLAPLLQTGRLPTTMPAETPHE